MILEILNLHVAPMPPTKFWLRPTYRLASEDIKMAAMVAILDIGMERFSEFLYLFDASHQVSAQTDLKFGRKTGLKNFKRALGYRNGTILAILNLYVTPMRPNKFGLNPTKRSGADVV